MATFDPFLPSAKKQRVGGNQSVAELERVSATDMDARKRTTQVVCLAVAAQLLATAFFENVWTVIVPPVAAALPILLLTMRSRETVEAIAPKLREAYAGVALVAVAVIASFAWSGDNLRLDLRFVRMVFGDLAIFWLASTLGVQAATSKHSS